MKTAYSIYASGDQCITVVFQDKPDLSANRIVHSLYRYLLQNKSYGWLDIIPAYTSLSIRYEAAAIRMTHSSAFGRVKKELVEAIGLCDENDFRPGNQLAIPVCYAYDFAPDLKALAKSKRLAPEKVMEIYASHSYTVFMIGFLPGFAYMGMVPDAIAAPRLATPRRTVSAGSVGIAGNQTGIYPMDSPGGWNIIGRTPVKLFDVHAKQPVLFQPGDEVTFYPITQEAFDAFDARSFNPISA